MIYSTLSRKLALLATVAPVAFATPALAQDRAPATTSTTAPGTQATPQTPTDEGANTTATEDVVVTGSFLRRTDAETPSPVTVIQAESLDKRGVTTIQDAIQTLSSNSGPALTNSFSANGAFASGASAVSLRGLSTNSTLVLFDGLRAAYYPLADDGSRNFVDLNTIPDDIVERIEVLRDGASSSYGADAIAGVVNIITKKEVKGVNGRAEAGLSDRADAAQYRLSLTAGLGDLDDDGYNGYISGFYYRSEGIKNRSRPFPFNTDDLRTLVGRDADGNEGNGPDGRVGGIANRTPTSSIFYVRPYDGTNTTAIPGGRYVPLNNAQCPTTPVVNDAASPAPATVCEVDYTNQYGTITPNIERFGGSARFTGRISDEIEGYAEFNFMQSRVNYTGFPATIRGLAPTGVLFPQFATDRAASATTAAGSGILALPVYVCPLNGQSAVLANGVATRPGGCTATSTGATLNPNNPFAAQGSSARILGRDLSEVTYNETRNRAYRGALGISGNITDKLTFDVGATAMHVDLRRLSDGYVFIQNLLNVVADGSYNFVNPAATPQSVRDYLTPVNITNAESDQYQLQATLGYALAELPGGPLQLGVGGSIRYESVNAPSANPDDFGPTNRYFTLNAFGTAGSRRIYSAFAELNAPIFDQLEINASGRYDKYSSGQDAFSPKIGAKFTPIRQVAIRGTYSRGFRIPSFGEANALPTTGYVTNSAGLFTDAFLSQYGCTVATFASCPTYIRGSYGLTTLASPNLEPEKSRSFTGGLIIEPIRNVAITFDYFNIKKTGAITSPDTGSAVQAYYANTAIDPSIAVIPGAPDPAFPNARPTIAFVQSTLINADTIRAEGIDGSISVNRDFGEDFRVGLSVEASYLLELSTTVNGVKQRYDGTLGNFNLTAGNGTSKLRGSALATIGYKEFELNGTLNLYGGYDLSATDQGTGYKDCGLNPGYSPTGCRVPNYWTFDLNAQIQATDRFTFYFTALNLFDDLPPVDVVTYGAHLYNAVQGGNGILGRYFKAGVKVGF